MVRELTNDNEIIDLLGSKIYMGLFKNASEYAKEHHQKHPDLPQGVIGACYEFGENNVWIELSWLATELPHATIYEVGLYKFLYCHVSEIMPDEFLDRINHYKNIDNYTFTNNKK